MNNVYLHIFDFKITLGLEIGLCKIFFLKHLLYQTSEHQYTVQ